MPETPEISRFGRPQRGRRIDAVGLKPIARSAAFDDVATKAEEEAPEAPLAVGARIGVVTFPGSLDDVDAARAVRLAGGTPVPLWHREADLGDVVAVVLPGGFSYGDYLRAGAIARFSPVMESVVAAAGRGMPVLGICNGFQVLCESHLLPGALVRNSSLHFVCRDQWLRVENVDTPWTAKLTKGQEILVPLKSGEGSYAAGPETLAELEGEGRVVFRYVKGNPNGSYGDIAGIRNAAGNVVGLMPHPEHAVESLTGPSTDGLALFTSALAALVAA